MREELLYFLWQASLVPRELTTTDGETVQIVDFGELNLDSGPDVFGIRMKHQGMEHIGNAEMHINSSDWYHHGHQDDPAYNNVILHLVYQHDKQVSTPSGPIPTIELSRYVEPQFLDRYRRFFRNVERIRCIPFIDDDHHPMLQQQIMESTEKRLKAKAQQVGTLFHQFGGDWEKVVYLMLAYAFGLKSNADPMMMLARQVPLNLIRRNADKPQKIDQLMVGTAGLCRRMGPRTAQYQDQYRIIQASYDLDPLPSHIWKYGRTRASSFPHVRVRQLGRMMAQLPHPGQLLEDDDLESLRDMLEQGWESNDLRRQGRATTDRLLIDGVMPIRFFRRWQCGVEDEAIDGLLLELPPQDNRITRKWRANGIPCDSAAQSQGMIELFNDLCRHKKCLNCQVGRSILRA